jgi:hypothetical protein
MNFTDLPDELAEANIFSRLQTLDAAQRMGYSAIGLMCREVQQRELWKHRIDPETGYPCRSFTRYVRVACPYSYSTAFAAKADVENLIGDLSADDIAEIPQSNFNTMKQLSTAVRKDPKVIHAAKTERPDEFVAMLRVKHPEQAIETRKALRFHPTESAAEYIESVLGEAERHGATSRDHALEIIARAAQESWEFEAQCAALAESEVTE